MAVKAIPMFSREGVFNMKKIIIGNHAIQRYKERVFNNSLSDELIIKRLKSAVKHGRIVNRLPGDAYHIKFENIHLAVKKDNYGNTIVLTCLGDKHYVNWYSRKRPKKIAI